MDPRSAEWWRRHGWTIALLMLAFSIAFAIRTIWTYPIVEQYGPLYTYAGGSDSYYHSRVVTYIILTNHNLIYDPMLKFPIGATNPREPLFDWMSAALGLAFAPVFGGNAVNSGAWFLDLQAPLWAALEVFPIYLIGREVSSRRTGLVAALIFPFLSGSIDTSTFGYADYQSYYTFILLVVVYAFIRTVKAVGHRRWVESYRHPRQYLPGLLGYLRTERTAVKWSVFTGVALGAFALSWQGYTFAILVIGFTALVAMLIERIRHIDSFGLYVSIWIIGLIAFAMAVPYYVVQGEARVFLDLPILLFFGTLALLTPFLLMRDIPWVFSIPALIGVVAAGAIALKLVEPSFFTAVVTGQNYFVKNLIYSTIAEAQAPSIDALIIGYGVVTFFLAFVGLAMFGWLLVHQRFKRHHIAFLIFAITSVYLPISASKFFLVGTPAYALLSAEAIHRTLDVGGYPQLRRSVASLTDRGGTLTAFRKSFKARHVLVLALVVGVLLPNIWVSMDAGIPSNTKDAVAVQINNTLPSWLKLNQSSPASNILGAAGSGLDTPNQYDSAAYNWLATQDTGIPEPQRPAFISWWDYGFQAIDQGQHPSVADNFQNGIDPAGQFLLAQNESLAIGVLAATLLQGEIHASGIPTLPPQLNEILAADGVNLTLLHRYLDDESGDYATVVSDPAKYLPVDPSTLTDDNAMYLVVSYYLADHLSLNGVSQVYDDLMLYTGWSIRYDMVDSRLFPFSGSDTGIFYAPAELTGRVVNSEGVPTTFFNVTILGSDGNTYPLGPLPAGVSAVQYNINWSAPFYNTMLYRTYIGYNGSQVGLSGGIPGLSGAAEAYPLKPGWMLQHFEIEYMTAYVCPGVKNVSANPGCNVAENRPTALEIANKTGGTANTSADMYFQGGESILVYYPGVTLYGRLQLPDGTPVPGDRVTVYDAWGTPHMTAVTSENGSFTLILPPGNDTVNVTAGALDSLNQSGTNLISSTKIYIPNALGFSPTAPTMARTFTVDNATVNGQVYWNVSGTPSYEPSTDKVVAGAQVDFVDANNVTLMTATTDPSGTFSLTNVPPGSYSVQVVYAGVTYNESAQNVSAGGASQLSLPLSPGTIKGSVISASTHAGVEGVAVNLTNASGVVASTRTGSGGSYTFTGVSPGNYTVRATGSPAYVSSPAAFAAVTAPGGTATVNLTIQPVGTVAVAVAAAGTMVPNASVRFTPLLSFAGTSRSAVDAVMNASTNSTLGTTSAAGVARLALPVGSYSVYATATVGGRPYVGLATLNVSGPGTTTASTLTLLPSLTVRFPASGASNSTSNQTVVIANAADGSEAIAWGAPNGSVALRLPAGSYSFLTLQGTNSTAVAPLAGFFRANLTTTTTLPLDLGASVTSSFTIGVVDSHGEVDVPASNATVVVSGDPTGPSLRQTSNAGGDVVFYLPTSPSGTTGGYCLTVTAYGFSSYDACGLSAGDLRNLTTLPLAMTPTAVALRVPGLPSNTSVTVNVTGVSAGTADKTLRGNPPFSFSLSPGNYTLTASATVDHGATVYLPSQALSATIPRGAGYANLTLTVVPQINATGVLDLPAGVAAANVTVALSSAALNLSVNGTKYTASFRATPASYSATVTGTGGGVTYVNVSHVTVLANGTIRPALRLSVPGVALTGTLVGSNGTTLAVNTTVTLRGPAGLTSVLAVKSGTFSATLPPGTYNASAQVVAPTSGPNGTYNMSYTTAADAACVLSAEEASCTLTLGGTEVLVPIDGTLVPTAGGAPIDGTVRLAGPYPSTNLTVLSAPSGTFSTDLRPGAYMYYANSSSGTGAAAIGALLALPSTGTNVTIRLAPAWTASLTIASPNGSVTLTGPTTITVKDAFGNVVRFPGLAADTTFGLMLAPGTYSVTANASALRNGVAGNATASASVAVSTGNVAQYLGLSVPIVATVGGSVVGPGTVVVNAGGQVTVPFTVRNTGNEPLTVHPVGSPAGWTFAFSPANFTLAPGANASGEVLITVPARTAVTHPPVALTFKLGNGTDAGAVSPAPIVQVVGYYGLAAGPIAGQPTQVGPRDAITTFYVNNTGNTNETVNLTVVDAARLASLGWNTSWTINGTTNASGNLNLTAGQNSTVTLNVSANATVAAPPGSVTVLAQVVGTGGEFSSTFRLPIPRTSVGPKAGSLVVTGPSLAAGPSGLPVWVLPLAAFTPAIALIVGIVTYRWWRTRRWTRR